MTSMASLSLMNHLLLDSTSETVTGDTLFALINTVEPPIMNSPNSEKPLILKFFQCTICILFNRFVPLNKENLQIMAVPILSLFRGFTVVIARGRKGRGRGEDSGPKHKVVDLLLDSTSESVTGNL